MKKFIMIILSGIFTSCSLYNSKIITKPFNFTVITQNDNQYYLPSMHSAIKVEILEQKIVADTLEVKYQAGINKKIKCNEIINLTSEVKFLKCENIHNSKRTIQLYEISCKEKNCEIVFLKDMK